MSLNARNSKTLASIFREPIPANILWSEVEILLIAVGCNVISGAGSRVRFEKEGIVAFFHRPHPQKEIKRYQVKDARTYLTKLGRLP